MINNRIDTNTQSVKLSGLSILAIKKIIKCKRILIIERKSSYHASIVVQSAVQFFTEKQCEAFTCCMFYNKNSQVSDQDVVILVCQSNETADLLDVQQDCKQSGAFLIAVTNRELNPIFKKSNCKVRIRAGIEELCQVLNHSVVSALLCY